MHFFKKASLVCCIFAKLAAVEYLFDETHQVNIVAYKTDVKVPNLVEDGWKLECFIDFDNGLTGYNAYSFWNEEHEEEIRASYRQSGPVNIIHYRYEGFFLVLPHTKTITFVDRLWIKESTELKNLKKIVSITENMVKKWFSKTKANYVIELEDGSCWIARQDRFPWKPWKIGAQVLLIGNSQKFTLINADSVRGKEIPVVKEDDIIDVEFYK